MSFVGFTLFIGKVEVVSFMWKGVIGQVCSALWARARYLITSFFLLQLRNGCIYIFDVLELVNDCTESGIDFFQRAVAFDGVTFAFLLVPFDERSGLVVVHVEAFLDGLSVVIGAA